MYLGFLPVSRARLFSPGCRSGDPARARIAPERGKLGYGRQAAPKRITAQEIAGMTVRHKFQIKALISNATYELQHGKTYRSAPYRIIDRHQNAAKYSELCAIRNLLTLQDQGS
jgi:hypothetical protein